jgi:ABC-2 type transport system permease protein
VNRMLVVARRELRSYFNSPVAYVIAAAFAVFCAIWFFFVQQFFARGLASLRAYFSIMPIALSVLLPALTMRSWAEERRLGTAELLLTLPFSEWQAVAGKYIASLAVFGAMVVLTLPVPFVVSGYGWFDPGQTTGEYVGLVFYGLAALATGQFVSSLCKNQISAFLGAAGILITLSLLDRALSFADFPGPVAALLAYASLGFHFDGFARGLIDTRDLFYFIAAASLFLVATVRVLTARKWR